MDSGVGQEREKPLSVSQFTALVKERLEPAFPKVWMNGEISNFSRARSGHLYFSIKDQASQIRATMWRSQAQQLKIEPRDGMEVLVQGGINVYAPRGEYSLNVSCIEEVGLGKLRLAFDRLKAKLLAEGLFDPDRKKPLPFMPRKVGVVTSPTGAAIQDMIRVIKQRYAGLHVLIYPVRVQGEGAAVEIAAGIRELDRGHGCDVIIVGRGGGSEEDLWAFNEETVARAIAAAATPIISAVGHEVDITISDLVADLRAATPSQAAELVVKTHAEYSQMVNLLGKSLDQAAQSIFYGLRGRLHRMQAHPAFQRLGSQVNDLQRRMMDLEFRLENSLQNWLVQRSNRLRDAANRLRLDVLQIRMTRFNEQLMTTGGELLRVALSRVDGLRQRLILAAGHLHDLSPTRTLERGFAVVLDEKGRVVRRRDEVGFGDLIQIRLAHDAIDARVVARDRAEQPALFDREE